METKPHRQLQIFFFPFLAPGHMIPYIDLAKLFASHGAKSTLITTPLNEPFISKSIQTNPKSGSEIQILVIKFPAEEVGLPQGCENANMALSNEMKEQFFKATLLIEPQIEQILDQHRPDCLVSDAFFPWTTDLAAKFSIPRIIFHGSGFFPVCAGQAVAMQQPHKKVSSDTEVFTIPNFPGEIKMTRTQVPLFFEQSGESVLAKVFKQSKECEVRSFGIIFNSFYELEPDYVDHYRKVLGRKAWHVGPVSLCNQLAEEKAEVKIEATKHECLNWLDSKRPNSVLYICFGSMTNWNDFELIEIALGLEAAGQDFIWVVKKEKKDKEEWLPEGFEERMEGKGLIIRDWAPQLQILGHQAIGGFVTHCGWNSILEGVSAGVPMITWPVSAEQFYNEKLVTQVLRTGVPVGNRHWATFVDVKTEASVKSEAVERAVTGVMVGDEAEEMRNRAKKLAKIARRAVEEGGSSYCSLEALLEELTSGSK